MSDRESFPVMNTDGSLLLRLLFTEETPHQLSCPWVTFGDRIRHLTAQSEENIPVQFCVLWAEARRTHIVIASSLASRTLPH